jgi:hypothetical protein
MGPMGPLGFIGYTGQRGAAGPEGRQGQQGNTGQIGPDGQQVSKPRPWTLNPDLTLNEPSPKPIVPFNLNPMCVFSRYIRECEGCLLRPSPRWCLLFLWF